MFYSSSAVIDLRRQILTSKVDPRAERVKPCAATPVCVFAKKINYHQNLSNN